MRDVVERCERRGAPGVRLLQSVYHNRSLCLYTKLGFKTGGTISKLDGELLNVRFPGYAVRPATKADGRRLGTPFAGVCMGIIAVLSSIMRSIKGRPGSSSISVRLLPTAPTLPSSLMPSPRPIRA